MIQTCGRCSRSNPAEAAYCYFDGSVLSGHAGRGVPLVAGTKLFASPFVFSSGRTCRNFDELALACHAEWSTAKELLRHGDLARFMHALGRPDLARLAQEASRFPDPDRGLDQLLAQFPTDKLDAPRLRVDPVEVNLGRYHVGQQGRFDVHLENEGMRLLYGSVVSSDCPWLTIGEAPGAAEKIFQFTGELTIPVHVRGERLRAGEKPLVGQILIESNGGIATVIVHVEVPVKPFPDGVLAGARSPRQIAEKAKAHPKEAVALFENKAVAGWYKENGWKYPVLGPTAAGLGAVQQFFEALGLTPPPKVEISDKDVRLNGAVGDQLAHTLKIETKDNRPVYAYAVSDQPWLEVGRPKLNGRRASIPLVVPSVPDRESVTLEATVTVTANGNQRFLIPVSLQIGASLRFTEPLVPTLPPGNASRRVSASRESEPRGPGGLAEPWRQRRFWLHAVPAFLLLAALAGIVVWDLKSPPDQEGGRVAAPAADYTDLADPEPRLGIQFNDKMRFGLVMLKERDPANSDKFKRLTYEERGGSNNTCLKIDGLEFLFGQAPARWVKKEVKVRDYAWKSISDYPNEDIEVTQSVSLVPGDQTRLLDTCLIRYTIENRAKIAHKVGLRVMLDTFIGANDGVPFAIPGQPGFLDTMRRFTQKEIPDFVQALERPDLQNPGTVAHLGLKGLQIPGMELEPIESMVIARWPGNSEIRWDWPPTAMNEPPTNKDSCVTLYWAERMMPPGEKRDLAFTYGLNALSSSASGNANLSLTAGGSFKPGGEFTVTAYVKNADPGQKVRLRLPPGLQLLPDQSEEQVVDKAGDYAQLSWRVKAGEVGVYTLEALTNGGVEKYQVAVKAGRLFD
jgi:hypothetical protein